MKLISKHLKKNEFLNHFLMFFTGTMSAQIITIATSPLLTRLYTPEDFGLFGTYVAIISLLIVFTTGRYEFAINTAEDDQSALSLYKIVNYFTIFSVFVMAYLLWYLNDPILFLLEIDTGSTILYFVPITLLFWGFLQSSMYLLNREKAFPILSKSKVVQSSGNALVSIAFGYSKLGMIGLMVGYIVGIILSWIYQQKKYIRSKYNLISNRNLKLKENFKKYKNYPLFNAPSAFFDTVAWQAPIFILMASYSEATVGFFNLTMRVVGAPLSLISASISQVFLSQVSALNRENKNYNFLLFKLIRILSLLGIIPLAILFFFGPWLFSVFFGPEWKIAGVYSQILSFGYFFRFVVSPLSTVFFIRQKVRLLSIIQSARAISTILLLIYCSIHYDIKLLLIAYSVHEAIFYLVYLWFIIKISQVKRQQT